MSVRLLAPVNASEIAARLRASLVGTDVIVTTIGSIDDVTEPNEMITFAHGSTDRVAELLRSSGARVVLVSDAELLDASRTLIVCKNPRLAFALVLEMFAVEPRMPGVAASARISTKARIGPRARVGENVVIDDDVTIGSEATIGHGVIITGKVAIGDRVIIKPSTVIGAEGFGFEFTDGKLPVRIPQLGGVIIGSDVEIGSMNTVCSGTVNPTVVEDFVKTDDHVHIAHNCVVKTRSILTAGAVLSGSVTVGADAWLGPNSSVINRATVGANSLVGIGAVVTKSVDSGVVAAGNPARLLRKR